jgi:F-type H+-transporting ATPase subunit b
MRIILGILIVFLAIKTNLYTAETGMPQLDPKYWPSQAFWLIVIFASLYLVSAKLFIPKIKDTLDNRDSKIKKDLDEAKNLKETAERKKIEYDETIEKAKKQVTKIIFESKNNLNLEIQSKKKIFSKEIEKEIEKAQAEILLLKKNSIDDICKISEDIASKIIEEISGDKLNESSIRAAISEISKKKMDKYL